MLHEQSEKNLKSLYKYASFVVQAICFTQTGKYIRHQKDLIEKVSPEEQKIIATFPHLKNGGVVHFRDQTELLFNRAKKWIKATK